MTMEDSREPLRRTRDLAALMVVIVVAAGIGEAAIFLRPDLTRTTAFIFGDQAYSLFVAKEVFHGARLYQDVAYQYGPLPVLLYGPFAFAFGNSPLVYLHFLLLASIGGLAAVYALVRRVLSPSSACLLTVLGVAPVFVLPGSLLGGYTSAFYMPIERLAIVLAALAWRDPASRSVRRAAGLGAVLALMQSIRFGPGLVLGAVIVALDAALLARSRPPGRLARWLRLSASTWGVLLAGEALMAVLAFGLLSAPIAADVLWPAYMQDAYAPAALRWPAWGGPRLIVAQYLNPLVGMALTCAAAWTITVSGERKTDSAGLLLLPLLFVAGAFTFFRTEHHFRQFAWMFAVGSAPAFATFRAARAVAVAGWLPVFAVVVRSAAGPVPPGLVDITCPNGWRLVATPEVKTRIAAIAGTLRTLQPAHPGPVMFYPNGSGFYVAYDVPHVSRQTWFFTNVVRPYELDTLAEQYRSLRVVVSCEGSVVFRNDFPAALRDPILRRLGPAIWRDDACAVFPLRPPAS